MARFEASTARVRVSIQDVYADGSGAPALVKLAGFTFACDILGVHKRRPVGAPRCSATERKIAERRASEAYAAELAKATDAAWMELNRAMYADLI